MVLKNAQSLTIGHLRKIIFTFASEVSTESIVHSVLLGVLLGEHGTVCLSNCDNQTSALNNLGGYSRRICLAKDYGA